MPICLHSNPRVREVSRWIVQQRQQASLPALHRRHHTHPTTRDRYDEDIALQPAQNNKVACAPGDDFCTKCVGEDCDTPGWVAAGDYASSGRTLGQIDNYLYFTNVSIAPRPDTLSPPQFSIMCSLNCQLQGSYPNPSLQPQ